MTPSSTAIRVSTELRPVLQRYSILTIQYFCTSLNSVKKETKWTNSQRMDEDGGGTLEMTKEALAGGVIVSLSTTVKREKEEERKERVERNKRRETMKISLYVGFRIETAWKLTA